MNYQKQVLATLEKCYAVAPLEYKGERCFLVAAEKHDRCLLFHNDGTLMETVWEGPGGVMTMEQIPGAEGAFLATQCFYSPNDSAEAKLVMAVPGDGGWSVRTVAALPFVHRFTILAAHGGYYVVAATLKSAHAFKDDWSCPGRIWVARLPEDIQTLGISEELHFTAIKSGLYKNHGFFKDGERALFGSENGVFRVAPTGEEEGWEVTTLLETPVSDMALIDLDGDGERELITYAPFHGDKLCVYKPGPDGYEMVYDHPEPLEFLHAICAGTLGGKPTLLVGYRKGRRELCALTYDSGYHLSVIDRDVGPANVMILQDPKRERILAANRETDEIALYTPIENL